MVRTTLETFEDADVMYVVVDATTQPGPGDRIVVHHIQNAVTKHSRPIFLAVNKVDLVNKSKLLPVLQNYSRLFPWTEVVPVSARSGDNVKRLLDITVALLPEGIARMARVRRRALGPGARFSRWRHQGM